MNVYVTTFDKKSKKMVKLILDLFSKDKGELKFKPLELNTSEKYNKMYDLDLNLEYHQIHDIGMEIKETHKIFGDYLVLLTDKKLTIPSSKSLEQKDWNSAFVTQTIIVKTTGYEKLTENRPYLGIAHQIIENIFQSLLKMQLQSPNLYRKIHVESVGCINDYCKDFKDIKTKIMSGRICKSCQDWAVKENVPPVMVTQIKMILQRINNTLNDNFNLESEKIIVGSHGKVSLGDTKIDFGKSTVSRLIYLFYLLNYNKVITKEDLLKNNEIRSKIKQLGELMDEPYNDFRLNTLIEKLSTPVNRIKKEIKKYTFNESLEKTLVIQSKKTSKKIHYYQIEIPDGQEIEIHNSMLQYRIL